MYLLRQNAEKNWKERKKQAYPKKKGYKSFDL